MITLEQRQLLLAYLGYYRLRYQQPPRAGDLAIDRLPGPALTAAIKHLQRKAGITEDGTWGPATEAAALAAVTAGAFAPVPEPPEKPEDIPGIIWEYLIAQGIQPTGVAGIMGNIDAESAMKPTNLEDYYQAKLAHTDASYTEAVDSGSYTGFVGDCAGYGLCQWTWHTRKKALLDKARALGESIGSLDLQLAFMMQELATDWPALLQRLRKPETTVYEATRLFMVQYENPADQSDTAIARRAQISQLYFEKFKER